jgi:DNA-binding IclR family transcriptional regulator
MNVAASSSPAVRPIIADRQSGSSTKHDPGKGCAPAAAARGVLNGAFAVLDALSHADNGLGLSALARASGIAKSSAYRLAEQLVELGAVQCIEHRYYIGPAMERIGRQWQPDPLLRQSAQAPVHGLAVQCRAMAALRILHEHRLRIVCATTPRGRAHMPNPADSESIARTATGRVLYAAQPASDATLPDCWTRREWRKLRESIRDPGATVVDHEDAVAGMCCVSAPVWWPGGACAGAVTAMVFPAQLRPDLLDLVSHTANRIGAGLRQPKPT